MFCRRKDIDGVCVEGRVAGQKGEKSMDPVKGSGMAINVNL